MISLRPRPVVLVLALVAVSACSSAAPTAPGGADTPAGPPLAIAVQPQSVTVDAGASATLSVIATGRAPLSYQWFAGASGTASEPIAGARESDYTTSSTSESSSYWVRVSDTSGALDSETATVTVRPRAQAPPPDPAGDEEEDEEEEDGEPGPPADPGPDPGPPPPPPSPPPPTPPPPPPPAETNPALEDQVLVLVNQHRAAGATCGGTPFGPVPALAMDPALRVAARGHSQDMAINDYFSHTSLDGRTFDQRIWNAGYTGSLPLGENIAAGQPTPAAVVAGWMSSAGHCANIMKPGFAEIGVGYAYTATSTYGHYWTQSFGGR